MAHTSDMAGLVERDGWGGMAEHLGGVAELLLAEHRESPDDEAEEIADARHALTHAITLARVAAEKYAELTGE